MQELEAETKSRCCGSLGSFGEKEERAKTQFLVSPPKKRSEERSFSLAERYLVARIKRGKMKGRPINATARAAGPPSKG